MPRRRWSPLRRQAEIERVRREGTRHRAGGVTVWVLCTDGPSRAVLAVPVGEGGHVARNRTRRRLRAALDDLLPERGVDVMIAARPPAPPFAVLRATIGDVLSGRPGGEGRIE